MDALEQALPSGINFTNYFLMIRQFLFVQQQLKLEFVIQQ